MKKTYATILCGLFIALQIVFERILVIDAGYMRISLVFIPYALGGAIFGPLWNGVMSAAADIIGFLIAPGQGAFFPGFTLSAFLSGFAYGFFYKAALPRFGRTLRGIAAPSHEIAQDGRTLRDIAAPSHEIAQDGRTLRGIAAPSPAGAISKTRPLLIRTLLAAFCVTILINACLNTLWVAILYNRAYAFYFGARFIKALIMLPVQVVVNGAAWRSLGGYIEKSVFPKLRRAQ